MTTPATPPTAPGATTKPNLDVLMDVPVQISVELGACQMAMREVLQLGPGSVVQTDKPAEAPVELFINDKLIARGEIVVLNDRFGVRITELPGQPA